MQEGEGADPVDHGSSQHAQQDRALDLFVVQSHDDEQADEHGDHGEHHLGVAGVAHVVLDHAGGQSAEEVAHHIEGRGEAVALGIDAHVGAQADVHQHQADGGADAQAHAQGDGFHDLFTDIEDGQDDEHDAFHQDDDQRGLEGGHIAHAGHGGDVGDHQGEEAVQAHAGGHGKGLVGQEGHHQAAHAGSDAGGQEHAVPQSGPYVKVGQQVGVQRDDVGHGHKRGQTGHDLGTDSGAVFFELK